MSDQPPDVASTLNELERKLRELEGDLQAAADSPPPAPPAPAPAAAPIQTPPPVAPPAPPPPPVGDTDPQQIVSEARRRISDLRAELDELARTREQIAETANELVSGYNRALAEQPPAPEVAPSPTPGLSPSAPVLGPPPASFPEGLPPENTLQQGMVSIDAGFFRDLTSLSTFEQALARIPGVSGIAVRGFAQGRALIDVQLAHPVALGAELARYVPMRFTVTEAGPQHLMLAIAG